MAAKKTGPLDHFRKQKPPDVSQEQWDAYIDTANLTFSRLPNDGSREKALEQMKRLTPEILASGYHQSTPQQFKDIGGELAPVKNTPGTPEAVEAEKLEDAEKVRGENKEAWEKLAGLPLDQLKSKFGLSDEEAAAAHDQFVNAVNGYVEPGMAEALPDLVSQAGEAKADQASIDAQYRALGKAEALTGIEETAEEKFMREQSRRTQERDLRSERGAIRNSLLARGAYGSGAEIAMNAQAQQEAAERRMLEGLDANANAQRRALDAIGQMGVISGDIRSQSFDERHKRGIAADAIREGNRAYKQNYNEWKRGEEVKAERDKIERAGLIKTDSDRTIAERDKRASALWGADADITAGSTGQFSKDSAPVANSFGSQGSLLFNREIQQDMEEGDDGFLGDEGIFGIKGVPIF